MEIAQFPQRSIFHRHGSGQIFQQFTALRPDLLCDSFHCSKRVAMHLDSPTGFQLCKLNEFNWSHKQTFNGGAPSSTNLLQTHYNAKPISGFHRHSSNITLQPSRSSSSTENGFAPYTTTANCNATVGVRPLQAFPATPGSSHA
eukprot:Gb_36207 [translate_table: standard]